ncbi:cytochrome P450 2J4-like [Amphiura filiformis]|uniref:cytochrome P450 2J4-like n=1 Tax=Amphiura filiformis TaxID=82378 RepID=UPI003B217946
MYSKPFTTASKMEPVILGFEIQTILLCVAAIAIFTWCLQKPKNLPPGPWGWPLVGYLPKLVVSLYRTGLNPHQLFAKMAKQYGPVFSMRIGGKVVVVLNKYHIIKQAFMNPRICDRPLQTLEAGITFSSGEAWKQQRRFTIISLRRFGVGKRNFEQCIAEEAEYLTEEMINPKRTSFDVRSLFMNAACNINCSVLFGRRYGYSDSKFKYLLNLLDQNMQLFGIGGAQIFFPILKYLQPSNYKLLQSNISKLINFINGVVKEHESDRDPDNPNDYIDVYLNEIESNQEVGRESHVNLPNMPVTVMNLFRAGTVTISTTLRWSVLYLMAYPEIQKRIQHEMDSVVGRDRFPRLSDKDKLPFTSAVLLEIQRITSIIPLGLSHSCGEDTTIEGYDIPKGSVVVSNLWAVHHDPDTWKNPDQFYPDRFLDKDGCLREREELIPFSTGRRICFGDQLAKMELYIFFTHLLHRFTFKKPNDSKPISFSCCFKGVTGSILFPDHFMTQVINRD